MLVSCIFIFSLFSVSYLQAEKNKDDIIKIYNDGEVIPILSDPSNMDNETNSWLWKFSGPDEYGFKVVLTAFDIPLIKEFVIKNTTDMFVNKRSAKEFHPYYNIDNYIEIYLTLTENKDIVFAAYLTLITKRFNKTVNQGLQGDLDLCLTVPMGKDSIYWILALASFLWPALNDGKNGQCSFNLIIPFKEEVDVTILMGYVERNVDFLQYSYVTMENDNITVIIKPVLFDPSIFSDLNFTPDNTFTLDSFTNGSAKHYLWEWITDGSIMSFPIHVEFDKIVCECNVPLIFCATKPHGIMKEENGRYCGNLRCNFIIEPCSSAVTLMKIQITDCYFDTIYPQIDNLDTFRVYSNGDVLMEINNYNRLEKNFEIQMNSSNKNIFEAITFSSKIARCLILSTAEPEIPIRHTVTLTPSVPFAVIDTGLYQSVVIVSEFNNSTFVLTSSKARGTPVFTNTNFFKRHVSSFCFSDYNLYQCKITSSKIGISVPTKTENFPMISVYYINYHQTGCIFNKYIFMSNADSPNVPITIISTAENECVITLLLDIQEYVYYTIKYYWTNIKEHNVEIYAGKESPFFEFNSHSRNQWTEIQLFSDFYTIKVPKKATVYMQVERQTGGFLPIEYKNVFDYEDTIAINVLKPDFYALMGTPEYGTSKKRKNLRLITYFFGNYTLKFTTLYCKSDKEISFRFYWATWDAFGYNFTIIRQTGDTFFFNNGMISLAFNFDLDSDLQNGVVFLIEVVH